MVSSSIFSNSKEAMMGKKAKVYIIVLNYKTWQDTSQCLESLLKLNYSNFKIVVVDNASPNNSMEHLLAWAKGEELMQMVPPSKLSHLTQPTKKKPIQLTYLSQAESKKKDINNHDLVFIKSDKNLGYSAGNNIGISYGLNQGDADFFWILNNDVVVEPDCLDLMIEKTIFYKQNNKKVGIVGGKIMHYHLPDRIQAASGSLFFKRFLFFRIPRPTVGLGNLEIDYGQYDREVDVDFVNGACMLVSREYVENVGLLSEEYFLYLEEPDWTERGKKNNWELGYSWQAKIYHKEGASSGGGTHRRDKVSFLSDFYFHRNKVLFVQKYYPQYLLFVYLGLLITILKRFFKGQWNRAAKFTTIFYKPTTAFNA